MASPKNDYYAAHPDADRERGIEVYARSFSGQRTAATEPYPDKFASFVDEDEKSSPPDVVKKTSTGYTLAQGGGVEDPKVGALLSVAKGGRARKKVLLELDGEMHEYPLIDEVIGEDGQRLPFVQREVVLGGARVNSDADINKRVKDLDGKSLDAVETLGEVLDVETPYEVATAPTERKDEPRRVVRKRLIRALFVDPDVRTYIHIPRNKYHDILSRLSLAAAHDMSCNVPWANDKDEDGGRLSVMTCWDQRVREVPLLNPSLVVNYVRRKRLLREQRAVEDEFFLCWHPPGALATEPRVIGLRFMRFRGRRLLFLGMNASSFFLNHPSMQVPSRMTWCGHEVEHTPAGYPEFVIKCLRMFLRSALHVDPDKFNVSVDHARWRHLKMGLNREIGKYRNEAFQVLINSLTWSMSSSVDGADTRKTAAPDRYTLRSTAGLEGIVWYPSSQNGGVEGHFSHSRFDEKAMLRLRTLRPHHDVPAVTVMSVARRAGRALGGDALADYSVTFSPQDVLMRRTGNPEVEGKTLRTMRVSYSISREAFASAALRDYVISEKWLTQKQFDSYDHKSLAFLKALFPTAKLYRERREKLQLMTEKVLGLPFLLNPPRLTEVEDWRDNLDPSQTKLRAAMDTWFASRTKPHLPASKGDRAKFREVTAPVYRQFGFRPQDVTVTGLLLLSRAHYRSWVPDEMQLKELTLHEQISDALLKGQSRSVARLTEQYHALIKTALQLGIDGHRRMAPSLSRMLHPQLRDRVTSRIPDLLPTADEVVLALPEGASGMLSTLSTSQLQNPGRVRKRDVPVADRRDKKRSTLDG